MLKRTICKIIAFILFLGAHIPTSFATHFTDTGKVAMIRLTDSSLGADWDWIGVEGFTSAGTCPLAFGYVALITRGNDRGTRMISLALTAKISGKEVQVTVDDTLKNSSGYCFIRSLDLID